MTKREAHHASALGFDTARMVRPYGAAHTRPAPFGPLSFPRVLWSARAGSQPVGSVRGGCRPLPEWNGRQPVTAGRGCMDDERMAVGRAAALNGSAAGGDTGAGGGFDDAS